VRIQELNAARLDVVIGMLFSNAVMFFIVLTSAAVLHAHGKTSIDSAAAAAAALQPFAGRFATVLFAAGMIGTGLLAVPILSGSAAYALKEFLGLPGNLADTPRYRPTFYAVIVLSVAAGVAMNLLHIDAIAALFWTAVINGLVAPPLLFLIVILGADKKVMGRHASCRLSKVLTGAATLLMTVAALAMILTTWVIR
jgi:Mn2+/Fe2+ NRAMP family transporter